VWASIRALSPALSFLGILALFGGTAAAEQFSADIVTTNAGDRMAGAAGKLYVRDSLVRFETPDFRNGRFLVNVSADTAFFVMPAQDIYMDAKESSSLTQILVPVDPDDPCQAWQTMAKIAGAAGHGSKWHCRRLGTDNIDGRQVIEYQATSPAGSAITATIDPLLKFPIRFQYQDGTKVELVDIREQPQPAALFQMPAGSRKFDPQQLIERIKRSDVWVEPPK